MTGPEAAECRKRLGYSQGQVAALLKASTPAVSRAESGQGAVREDLAKLLNELAPAPRREGARGPYKKQPTPAPAPRQARRAQVPRVARVRSQRPPPSERMEEPEELPILSAIEAGAVLEEEVAAVAVWAREVAMAARRAALEEEVEVAFARLLCRPVPLPTRHARACWRRGAWRP